MGRSFRFSRAETILPICLPYQFMYTRSACLWYSRAHTWTPRLRRTSAPIPSLSVLLVFSFRNEIVSATERHSRRYLCPALFPRYSRSHAHGRPYDNVTASEIFPYRNFWPCPRATMRRFCASVRFAPSSGGDVYYRLLYVNKPNRINMTRNVAVAERRTRGRPAANRRVRKPCRLHNNGTCTRWQRAVHARESTF